MSCLKIPVPTIPTLPAPFKLALPEPPEPPGTPGISPCCKLPPIPLPSLPISVPPIILNAALIAALNAAITTVTGYLHSLPLNCPLE